MLSPFECLCGNFILPESASYVFFYAIFNLRKLLYIIQVAKDHLVQIRSMPRCPCIKGTLVLAPGMHLEQAEFLFLGNAPLKKARPIPLHLCTQSTANICHRFQQLHLALSRQDNDIFHCTYIASHKIYANPRCLTLYKSDEQNSWKEQPTNKANGNRKSLGHLKGAKNTAR